MFERVILVLRGAFPVGVLRRCFGGFRGAGVFLILSYPVRAIILGVWRHLG